MTRLCNRLLTLNRQILILADETLEDSVVHSDSRSLATLLLIRDIQVHLIDLLVLLHMVNCDELIIERVALTRNLNLYWKILGHQRG